MPIRFCIVRTAILLLGLHLSCGASPAQTLVGRVVSETGEPLSNVEVYGVKARCCKQPEGTWTDAKGEFRLRRPGAAIHLRRSDLAPQTILPNGHKTVQVVMEPEELSTKVLPACTIQSKTRYGYHVAFFTSAPMRESSDVDYEMFDFHGRGGGVLQAWFGGSASSIDPFDPSGRIYSAVAVIHERFVRDPLLGIIGIESSGTYRDGRQWRWLGVQKEPAPKLPTKSMQRREHHHWRWNGAWASAQIGYLNARAEDRIVFDSAIDSACIIQE